MGAMNGKLPPLFSGDGHLEVAPETWIGRVPSRYRDKTPRTVRLPEGGEAIEVPGHKPVPLNFIDLWSGKRIDEWGPIGATLEGVAGVGSPSQRLAEQDEDGIMCEVLFPNMEAGPIVWSSIEDPEAYRATVRAYNDWLAEDYCSTARDRLLGMGVVPWTSARDAITEMEHCARLGLKGVVLGVFPSGKGYPTPEDDEFWAAAVSMKMPLSVHFGFDRSGPRAYQPVLEYPGVDEKLMAKLRRRHLAVTVAYFGLPSSLGMSQLILSSVFDRFPDLKIFFAETRLGWVPFWAETANYWVDQHRAWHERLLGFRTMKRPFSDYVRDNLLFSVHAIEHAAADLHDRFNPRHVMFATDFPHVECQWPHTREHARQFFARLPADLAFRIGAGNMVEFFHLQDTAVGRAALAQAPSARPG